MRPGGDVYRLLAAPACQSYRLRPATACGFLYVSIAGVGVHAAQPPVTRAQFGQRFYHPVAVAGFIAQYAGDFKAIMRPGEGAVLCWRR